MPNKQKALTGTQKGVGRNTWGEDTGSLSRKYAMQSLGEGAYHSQSGPVCGLSASLIAPYTLLNLLFSRQG